MLEGMSVFLADRNSRKMIWSVCMLIDTLLGRQLLHHFGDTMIPWHFCISILAKIIQTPYRIRSFCYKDVYNPLVFTSYDTYLLFCPESTTRMHVISCFSHLIVTIRDFASLMVPTAFLFPLLELSPKVFLGVSVWFAVVNHKAAKHSRFETCFFEELFDSG